MNMVQYFTVNPVSICMNIGQQTSYEGNFGKSKDFLWHGSQDHSYHSPYHPCMVYLPTFGWLSWQMYANVGKSASPMDAVGTGSFQEKSPSHQQFGDAFQVQIDIVNLVKSWVKYDIWPALWSGLYHKKRWVLICFAYVLISKKPNQNLVWYIDICLIFRFDFKTVLKILEKNQVNL